jgi:preprotein translocase subunit SecE
MARDRKRAKQRRAREARSGAARERRTETTTALPDELRPHEPDAPELASGEVDLADAQLALGRPELIEETRNGGEPSLGGSTTDEVLEHALHDEGGPIPGEEPEGLLGEQPEAIPGEELDELEQEQAELLEAERRARAVTAAPAPRPARREEGGRFASFLRGSWRELERVQWPDRRQVVQATAVVIGFVIVAGAFLGLTDYVAAKIVDFLV